MTSRAALAAFLALVLVVAACRTVRTREYPLSEDRDLHNLRGVVMLQDDGSLLRVEFRAVEGYQFSDTSLAIAGRLRGPEGSPEYDLALQYRPPDQNYFRFPTDRIQGVLMRELNGSRTALAIVAVPVATVGLLAIVLAASSCPILYAYDGESYHPDGEPLGGATTRGLERADLTRLERMRPSQGRYRLNAVNEMDETQFVDALSLVVVDHPPGTEMYPDRQGNLHLVSNPVPPRSAVLQGGEDIRPFLLRTEGNRYTFAMERSLGQEGLPPRDTLLMEFPKPPEATEGRFVVRAGTTPWGALMLRQMLEYWGADVDEWYELLDGSQATRAAQEAWVLREEHWVLKVWVEEDAGWVAQEVAVGTGPLVPETQVVPLDLSRVTGEVVRIRLDPPRGFWDLDYAAMDFGTGGPGEFVVHRIQPQTAEGVGAESERLLSDLREGDSAYVELGAIGDQLTLEFPVPEATEGLSERTVFANTRGFYRIHTKRVGERQTRVLDRLWLEPDYGVELSFSTFSELKAGNTAAVPAALPLRGGG